MMSSSVRRLAALSLVLASSLGGSLRSAAAENGLLFYLSGEKGTTADFSAAGTAAPTFDSEITKIPDGARGAALSCADTQALAYRAPGNIYAQRGTLSLFWRSRYPVGPTAFPIFRVGYGDHSSWDMCFLRIDYNGHGFDAYVTDISLARTRVSVALDSFPRPSEWVHLTLAWDETRGIRFYVNGRLAAKNETQAVYNAALDQFGPHSRIIGPWHVQSDYNYVRGGDIDEVRIYDRMVDDADAATLARGEGLTGLPALPARNLADARWRDEWRLRYGFNRPGDLPPELPAGRDVSVRKVEIHDAYDLKRWYWKALDGIPETTWPGVYNRSRLPGRNDYFQLPDWDCYVDSGKAVTFLMPDEPWNQLEISGAAWGRMELLPPNTAGETASDARAESLLFLRPQGQEKTVHRLAAPLTGRQIRFTNDAQEEPIGELSAYYVAAGLEPAGSAKLSYELSPGLVPDGQGTAALREFIAGRFAPDERSTLVAQPAGAPAAIADGGFGIRSSLPLLHVLIPDSWDQLTDGLDGIAVDLPALPATGGADALQPINLQVKDPLWPMRNMCDFTFSVKPGEAKTLWLDLRDRLLPPKKALWLTLAAAEGDPRQFLGAKIRLVFKPRAAALAEHEEDRFTQAKDNYAMLVEEHPNSPKYNIWNRFKADLQDLLRVDPQNKLGVLYAAASGLGPKPVFAQPAAPADIPLWAFRQTELLGRVKSFVLYYIDHRQSAFGDFGGGISDDVDLLNTWPGVALMGSEPDKIRASSHALLEAAFKNGMFTNGLPTIQADELHSYEEGINCLAQNLIIDYGNPRQLERAMVTARGVESLTGVNAAGHRHIRTSYYNGKKMAEEAPWGETKPYSYLVCQVPQLLVDYNGSPEPKKFLLELTDGMLAHRHVDARGHGSLALGIRFADDAEVTTVRGYFPWHMFWGAWKWTGDRKYLVPLLDGGMTSLTTVNANLLDLLDLRATWGPRFRSGERGQPTETRPENDGRSRERTNSYRASTGGHTAWQLTGDKANLERLYATQIEECADLDYINTVGSLWIDRVGVPYADLQRARLGGVALVRNSLYPGHVISWRFHAPANDQSVAILVPRATTTEFKVVAYNLETTPVQADLTGWNVDPGVWEITQGIDSNNADTTDVADRALATSTAAFGRSQSVALTLAPRAETVLTFKLRTPGTPYWQRSDLGLNREDVQISGNEVAVTIHNVGAIASPETSVVLRGADGAVLATATVPAIPAPLDLQPKTAVVHLSLAAGAATGGGSVEIDPDHRLEEITELNNVVKL